MCKTTNADDRRKNATPGSSHQTPADSACHCDSAVVVSDEAAQKEMLQDGVKYGTVSLAVLVLANTVTMGHYQNKLSELGCDSLCVGSMTSVRSTLTLIGSTIVGMISDSSSPIWNKVGGARKACMIIGVMASAVSLAMASSASDLTTVWMSMVPSSLFNQNFNVLKALFGDYQPPSASSADRAGSVGMLGMAAGIAFMIGPLTGSTVLDTYDQASAFSLCCLAFAMAVIVVLLPAPRQSVTTFSTTSTTAASTAKAGQQKPRRIDATSASSRRVGFEQLLPDLAPVARTKPAIFLMASRFCMGLAFHIFQTIWTVALKTKFDFGPKQYGYYFAFIGLIFALSQGFVAKQLLERFGGTTKRRATLLLVCCLLLGGGRILVYYAPSLWIVYGLYGPIVMALGVVNTIFTAETSNIASPQELGGLFGIIASVESLAGILGPVLGGFLAKVHKEHAPLAAVTVLYGIVFAMVLVGYEDIFGRSRFDGNPTEVKKKTA